VFLIQPDHRLLEDHLIGLTRQKQNFVIASLVAAWRSSARFTGLLRRLSPPRNACSSFRLITCCFEDYLIGLTHQKQNFVIASRAAAWRSSASFAGLLRRLSPPRNDYPLSDEA
jgi:hypothetical protein